MLIYVEGNAPTSTVSISDPVKEEDYRAAHPEFIQSDFVFAEPMKYYEYDGTTFNLVSGWEALKAAQEAEEAASRLAVLAAKIPSIANAMANQAFIAAIAAGYTNAGGIVMQADKRDYEMMRDGLAVFLAAPVEYGGSGGDTTALTTVRDKDNAPHVMTIADAQTLAQEMMQNYWVQWARKGTYRDALIACTTIAEMDSIVF